jgi:multiple sugar transport system substrate-binding protein
MKKMLAVLLVLAFVLSLAACAADAPSEAAADPAPAASGDAAPAATEAPASTDAPASDEAPAGDVIELDYWFEGADTTRTPIYEGIINSFNEKGLGIHVTGTYVDLSSGLEKVTTSHAGGMLPDVIYSQDSWESALTAQGIVIPLDDLFEAWDEKDQFMPASVASVRSKDMAERLCFIPTSTNITGIWYRKDIFAENSVEAPTTWDNFFTAVETLSDPAAGVYGHTLRGGAGSTNALLNAIICYSGYTDFWSEDGKAQVLRSAEAEELTNKFRDMYQNGWVPESSLTAGFNEMVADFDAGLAMTLIHNLGSYQNQREFFTPDQYAFVPYPPSVSGRYVEMQAGAKGLCITVNAENVDAAWEFVKHHASHENISTLNEHVGEMPTRVDASNDEWVKTAPHMSNLPEYAATDKDSVLPATYLPDWKSILTTYTEPAFQQVLVGDLSAREFLDEWANQVEAANVEYETQKEAAMQ